MLNILCVDNNPHVLTIYRSIFASEKSLLTEATSCQKAIEALSAHAYDWVILSLELRDDSGLAVFEEIQKMIQQPQVILITEYPRTGEWIQKKKSQGVTAVLRVPVSMGRLRRLVFAGEEISKRTY